MKAFILFSLLVSMFQMTAFAQPDGPSNKVPSARFTCKDKEGYTGIVTVRKPNGMYEAKLFILQRLVSKIDLGLVSFKNGLMTLRGRELRGPELYQLVFDMRAEQGLFTIRKFREIENIRLECF